MRILFVIHDAVRGGAQLLALQYVKYFIKQPNIALLVVLQREGELKQEIASLTTTITWPIHQKTHYNGILGKFYKKISKEAKERVRFYKTIKEFKPAVIYVNSVAALKGILLLKELLQCPLICHVHELNMSIRYYCGEERFTHATSYISHYIAASDAVKDNLVNRYNIYPQKVSRIYECVSIQEIERARQNTLFDARKELGIPADAFIVGCSGTFEWRKAPDIFVQIAIVVQSKTSSFPVYFVWVGGDTSSEVYNRLVYDVEQGNAKDYIKFVGATAKPWEYFLEFDIFMLTSREDPFPVVCLEAAAMGKPILCFESAGGIPEFVQEDAGIVVPYLDVAKMAKAIELLAGDNKLRYKLGKRAMSKVAEKLDTGVIAPQIWETIVKVVNGSQ